MARLLVVEDDPAISRPLDMHISSLRRKLGDDPARPGLITAVRGVGFRFEAGAAEPG